MLRFISLGSGTSGNSYLLMTDSDNLMIDAGIEMPLLEQHFHSLPISLSSVKRILLTHEHVDHTKSAGEVSQKYDIPVYAISSVHEGINANQRIKDKIPTDKQIPIKKEEALQFGDFLITPFAVPHDCPSGDTVGYKIQFDNLTISIITDCGFITERIGEVISESNYLVIESNHDSEMLMSGDYPETWKEKIASEGGHLSNMQCAEALINHATPELRHVWLCHLSEENNHPELARKTIEGELRKYGIVVGTDFQLDVLKRKQPSKVFEL